MRRADAAGSSAPLLDARATRVALAFAAAATFTGIDITR
jgi:hypothetical protein